MKTKVLPDGILAGKDAIGQRSAEYHEVSARCEFSLGKTFPLHNWNLQRFKIARSNPSPGNGSTCARCGLRLAFNLYGSEDLVAMSAARRQGITHGRQGNSRTIAQFVLQL